MQRGGKEGEVVGGGGVVVLMSADITPLHF